MVTVKKFFLISLCFFVISFCYANEVDKYKMSLSLYNDGFADIAGKSFSEFLQDYPTSIYRDKAMYYLALTQIQAQDYKSAVQNLSEVVTDQNFIFYNDAIKYLVLGYFMTEEYSKSEQYLNLVLQKQIVTEKSDSIFYEKLLYISVINNLNLKKYQKALNNANIYLNNSKFNKYRFDVEKYLLNHYIDSADYYNAAQMCMLIFEEPKLNVTDRILVEYDYVLSLYEQRKYEEAIDFFNSHINYYNEALYLLISETFFAVNDTKKSIEYLTQVYNRKKSKDILLRISSLYISNKDYNGAIAILEDFSPKDDAIFEMLGDMYYRKTAYPKAFEYFSKVNLQNLNSENFLLYFNCIVTLNKTELIPQFAQHIEKINNITEDGRNNVLYKIAETLYNNKQYKECEKVLSRWLNEFVGDAHYDKILFMQAMCLKINKKYDQAIVELTKLQKYMQKEQENYIFKESFAEKGDLYFIIREYHSAIESFKKYVTFVPTMSRHKEVLLQLGNAYYNIKDYDNAFLSYSDYIVKYGASDSLYTKVANSLLKPEKYEEIKTYFADKQNIGDYANYVKYYASYKLNDTNNYINEKTFVQNQNSEYLLEMIYLSILARNEHKTYDGINEEYVRVKEKIKSYEQTDIEKTMSIKKEYLKAFIYLGNVDLALNVFDFQDANTNFFVGKSFFDGVYLEQAKLFFDKLLEQQILNKLDNLKLTVLIEFYLALQDYNDAYKCVIQLCSLNMSDKNLLLQYEIAFLRNDVEVCNKLFLNVKNQILKEYFNISNQYLTQTINLSKYKKSILGIINNKKIDNVLSRQILLKYLKLQFADQEYEDVYSIISKIPEKEFPSLSPEFKFLQASSCLALKNEKQAIADFLKIYYIYQNDSYWVEKAIREIVILYRQNNDVEKANKVIEMYENRFYLNKFVH